MDTYFQEVVTLVIRLPFVPVGSFQFGADIRVIVYFTVEGNPETAVLIAHGLRCRVRQVYDGEAAVPESDPPVGIDPDAAPIGATMGHGITHS